MMSPGTPLGGYDWQHLLDETPDAEILAVVSGRSGLGKSWGMARMSRDMAMAGDAGAWATATAESMQQQVRDLRLAWPDEAVPDGWAYSHGAWRDADGHPMITARTTNAVQAGRGVQAPGRWLAVDELWTDTARRPPQGGRGLAARVADLYESVARPVLRGPGRLMIACNWSRWTSEAIAHWGIMSPGPGIHTGMGVDPLTRRPVRYVLEHVETGGAADRPIGLSAYLLPPTARPGRPTGRAYLTPDGRALVEHAGMTWTCEDHVPRDAMTPPGDMPTPAHPLVRPDTWRQERAAMEGGLYRFHDLAAVWIALGWWT